MATPGTADSTETRITFAAIDITGYTNLTFSAYLRKMMTGQIKTGTLRISY